MMCYNRDMKKYEQIYEDIINKIKANEILIGDSLKSENELSREFNTSRVTVRRALNELENEGIILKQQGKESIVVNNQLKPKTILLVLPNLFKYIFIDLIREIETTLREQGINLLIACSYNNQKIEYDIIQNYSSVVDGIIIEPTQAQYMKHINQNTYSYFELVPTVCINAQIDNRKIPFLRVNDKLNMQKVTEYAVNNGKNRILILAKTDDLQGYERLAGIKSVLDVNAHIKYRVVEFTTYNEHAKMSEFARKYFNFKPDCIMFYNDEYAYKFLSQYSINPENVLVTGFDNTEYANGFPYEFISPDHPKGKMGKDAANLMINLLNKQNVSSLTYEVAIDFEK